MEDLRRNGSVRSGPEKTGLLAKTGLDRFIKYGPPIENTNLFIATNHLI